MAHIKKFSLALNKLGSEIGNFMPWHTSTDLYHWLIAELLLRRTTRTAACKAYIELINFYPNWFSLALATIDEIKKNISWVGLGNQRSRQLKAIAVLISNNGNDSEIISSREKLESLPGVGRYIADVILLNLGGKKEFPVDANVQRVLRRNMGLDAPISTRHVDPYKDNQIIKIIENLKQNNSCNSLVSCHKAVLSIGWNSCRSQPKCNNCPINQICVSYGGPIKVDTF